GKMLRFERGERDGQTVSLLQAGVTAKIGEAFALLLSHVVAVGFPGCGNRGVPAAAAHGMERHFCHRITNVIVITDGIPRLGRRRLLAAGTFADVQQCWIEVLLLRSGVDFKKHRQPLPNGGQRVGVGPVDVIEDRKTTTLLAVVIANQLTDVHVMAPKGLDLP
ncbi:MAG: hypothetical protein ABI379_04870, partial [Rhodanobacter sp.]